mmetsp:Transcript_147/g.222  ORF Transcript_147/g.222 Transcript_147/m.222 type:complete len:225 (+) Transcript_147:102-776(+)
MASSKLVVGGTTRTGPSSSFLTSRVRGGPSSRRPLRWAIVLAVSLLATKFLSVSSRGWAGPAARPSTPSRQSQSSMPSRQSTSTQLALGVERPRSTPKSSPVVMRGTSPGVPKQVEMWVRDLIDSMPKDALKTQSNNVGAFYELAVEEAGKLLMTVAPIMGAVTLADSLGLIYVADLSDILEGQMLINSGKAASAALAQEGGRINLQLLLRDGSARMVELFRGA